MGQAIVYCARCLQRLTGGDFEKGKARRLGARVACSDCYPHVLAGLDPEERARLEAAAPATASTRRIPVRPAPSTTSLRAPTSTFRNPWPMILVLGAVAVAAAGALLVPRSSAPPPVPPPPAVRGPSAPPAEDPAYRTAREALAAAEALRRSRPDDLDAHVAAFEDALRKADRTPTFPDALKAYEAAVAARKQRQAREADALAKQVEEAAARGDFRAARELCARAAERPGQAALAGRLQEGLRPRAERWAVDAAQQTRKGGDAAALRGAVESWGWPDLVDLFDRAAETRPWRAVFAGSLDFLMEFFKPKWALQDGVLVPREQAFSGKTREEFGDVEVRIRLEFREAGNLYVRIRQDGTGFLGLEWSRVELDPFRNKPLEIVLSVRGDQVEVTANGRPMPAARRGSPRRGPIQFGGVGSGFVWRSIEVRP